jgi:hypothetical protein
MIGEVAGGKFIKVEVGGEVSWHHNSSQGV